MDLNQIISLVFPTLIAILGFLILKLYQKWHEGDTIKEEIHEVSKEFRHFKDATILDIAKIENAMATERQERIQMVTAVENRIYDFLNEFKKDVKCDIKDISIKLEQSNKKDEDWRNNLSKQLATLIIHKVNNNNEQ